MPDSQLPVSNEVLVERVRNIQADVSEIKTNMATKDDQKHTDDRISDLVGAIAGERVERIAAVASEKQERVAADKATSDRLQLVEDRMEARKYSTYIAILLGALGSVFSIVAFLITRGL